MKKTLLITALAMAGSAHAVDGVVLIDQAKALAGNVTPGDAPGYPVTISQPGSYRLSGNLTVPSADAGALLIAAGGVQLDLNGFAISGPVTCTVTIGPTCSAQSASEDSGIGIAIAANLGWAGIAVRNGLIRGLGGMGLRAGNGSWGLRLDELTVMNNGRGGIVARGALVNRSLILANNGPGVEGFQVLMTESQAANNNGYGMGAEGARGGNFFQSNHGAGANPHVRVGVPETTPNVCGSGVCP